MKIPYGLSFKDVGEKDIRDVERALLERCLTDDDIKLLDAILSWFAVRLPNVKADPADL